MKNKPKEIDPKKEIGLKDARCCTTCYFAKELSNITIECSRHRKKYFSWKICKFYKKDTTLVKL